MHYLQLFITSNKPDNALNVMFMQFGQFLDHDLTLGASTRATVTGLGLQCCNMTRPAGTTFHPGMSEYFVHRSLCSLKSNTFIQLADQSLFLTMIHSICVTIENATTLCETPLVQKTIAILATGSKLTLSPLSLMLQ